MRIRQHTCWPKPSSGLPGQQAGMARSSTTVSITTSTFRQDRRRRPARIEVRCARSSPPVNPSTRRRWTKLQALEHTRSAKTIRTNARLSKARRRRADQFSTGTGEDWVDLCRGPHVHSSQDIGAFKLTSVSAPTGAATKTGQCCSASTHGLADGRRSSTTTCGRSKRPPPPRPPQARSELSVLLRRGCAWPASGTEGLRIIHELDTLLQHELNRRGYQEISKPSLVKSDLWRQSGHWTYYEQGMYKLEVEDEDYAFKPMNCPESTLVYRFKTRRYRDLPLRFARTIGCYATSAPEHSTASARAQLTMDDAHISVAQTRLQDEIRGVISSRRRSTPSSVCSRRST